MAKTLAALAAVAAAGCGSTSAGSGVSAVPIASATATGSLQQQFVSVVQAVSPSVVQIRSGHALGSGVVFDARGDVVTNAHVIGTASRAIVTLASGDSHPAIVVGTDRANDLALIRFTGGRPRPATFADSSQLQVGDIALAIGNPLGLRSSVSEGNGVTLSSVIQTSAAVNPGNSGGALVDLSGRVTGIPTLSALDPQMGGGEAPGIGFAIDSNAVRQVAAALAGGR